MLQYTVTSAPGGLVSRSPSPLAADIGTDGEVRGKATGIVHGRFGILSLLLVTATRPSEHTPCFNRAHVTMARPDSANIAIQGFQSQCAPTR